MPEASSRYARLLAGLDRVFTHPLYTARMRRVIPQSFLCWITSLLTVLIAATNVLLPSSIVAERLLQNLAWPRGRLMEQDPAIS